MKHLSLVVAALVGACGFDDSAAIEDRGESTFEVEGEGPLTEGSPEALAILELANTATFEVLDATSEVGLSARAAANIVAHRIGADRVAGTPDDDPFDTLAELDRVPFVGANAFARLLAYVRAHPPAPVCDDADLDRYATELPSYYVSAMPASLCIAPQRFIAGYDIDVCDRQTCADGSIGCEVTMAFSDVELAELDPETLQATVAARVESTASVGIRASVNGIEVFACAAEPRASSAVSTPVTVVPDSATIAITTTAELGTSRTTHTVSGCPQVGSLVQVISDQLAAQLDGGLPALSQQTLASYATTCE
jgi:hypothetical protein